MTILRRTRRSFCLVLVAGFLLSSVYVLVVRNPRADKDGKAADRMVEVHADPRMETVGRMTVESASSGLGTSYVTTNQIDEFVTTSSEPKERVNNSGSFNERLQDTVTRVITEPGVPHTTVLGVEDADFQWQSEHQADGGKTGQTLLQVALNFNEDDFSEAGTKDAQDSKEKSHEEFYIMPPHGETFTTVQHENGSEKFLLIRSTPRIRNSSHKVTGNSSEGADQEIRQQPLCKYPELQMNSSEFSHLFRTVTELQCGENPINYLTYLDRKSRTDEFPWDVVKLNSSALRSTQKLLHCAYSRIERTDDYHSSFRTLYRKAFASNNETIHFPFKDEFAKVTCLLEVEIFNQTQQAWVNVTIEHNNMFVQLWRNENLVKHKKAQIEKEGRMESALGHGMNVLMVGVDSTSRMNFMRKLPQTFRYFTETLEGHVLKGYHVIGDGTTTQFIGMLTGFHERELPEAKRGYKNSSTCDVFPLVWEKFKRMGYTTMHGEDEAFTGTFQFRLQGFRLQPTDYYMRPFWVAQDNLPESYEWFCFGATPKHHYTLKYVRDFVEAYHDMPKFAIAFHTELSHDSLNMVQVADEDILNLISSWKNKGYLNNTVLILFADHGARYGDLRKLLQGRLEERLPFFGIAVPHWMKETHPEIIRNLRKNEERLTTAFDFHKMLQHIMDYPGDPSSFQGHGISLFQEIPLNRTCEDASVADHWCTCLESISLNTQNKVVREAAEFTVSYINSLTAAYRSLCAELFLKNVTHAEVIKPNQKLLQFGGSDPLFRNALFGEKLDVPFLDLRITVETEPNGGAYEVSVRKWMSVPRTEITADISRINMYGNHPRCIQDKFPRLRKFCFCKEFLTSVS